MTVEMKMKAELLLSLMILAMPAAARSRARRSLPAPEALVLKALAGPATGYTGLMRVQMFRPGGKPKGVTVAVAALPGGRVRRETKMGRRKTAGLICVRDGRTASLSWPAQKRSWSGPDRIESPEAGLARLSALYELAVSTGGLVAKHTTWRVNLSVPGGRVRRSLWVDRASGLLLKSENYRPDGTLARRERFMKLALPSDPDASVFRMEPAAGTHPAASFVPGFPRWAPDGFMLVEASSSRVRYSDGAANVTVEVFPAQAGPRGTNSRTVKFAGRELKIAEDKEGYAIVTLVGSRFYVFFGDLPEDELVRMALSVEDGR